MLQRVDRSRPHIRQIKIIDFGTTQEDKYGTDGQLLVMPDIRSLGNVCDILVDCTDISDKQNKLNLKVVFYNMDAMKMYSHLETAFNDLFNTLNILPDPPLEADSDPTSDTTTDSRPETSAEKERRNSEQLRLRKR